MKDFKRRSRFADDMRLGVTALVLAAFLAGCSSPPVGQATPPPTGPVVTPTHQAVAPPFVLHFDGSTAYNLTAQQVVYPNGSTRYRIPNTTGNEEVARWASDAFHASGWNVSLQPFTARYGCEVTPMHNVVAQRNGTSGRMVILGAHYDTRPIAESEEDPQLRTMPIPGAGDGASGVALLVELAKVLPRLNDTVRIVLFDGEDGGEWKTLDCTDWLLGSRAYAAALNDSEVAATRAFVLVDLVADPNLRLPREISSDRVVGDQLYAIGAGLGYGDVFLNATQYGETYSIEDDHTPFHERGIAAVDLIHLEPDTVFPEWHHTLRDDMTHVSAASLAKVGRTLELWVLQTSN